MSMSRLVFPTLAWAELWEILSFLTLKELWVLGCTCRSAFVTFLREKAYRSGLQSHMDLCKYHAKFLAKLSMHEKVLLVSYPRSGNSYVRKLMELKTGIITGSDSRPNRTLTTSLLKFGYCGEGITDQSVWLVKSHYPERLGYIKFPVKRVVFVVRNPFDALESYFHMGMTNTHDKILSPKAFNSLGTVWKEFIENEMKAWVEFHQFWIEKMELLPILLIRYEDILQDESSTTERIFQFLMNGKPPTRMKKYTRDKTFEFTTDSRTPGYKPKSNKQIGKALRVMSIEQVKNIINHTNELLDTFGYQIQESSMNTEEQSMIVNGAEQYRISLSDCKLQCTESMGVQNHFMINDNISTRSPQDKFGRRIFEIRQLFTDNDKSPLETM